MKKVLSIFMLASATTVFAEKSENLVKMEDWKTTGTSIRPTIKENYIHFGNAISSATLTIDIQDFIEYDSIFISTDYLIEFAGTTQEGVAFAQFELLSASNQALINETLLDWKGKNFTASENLNTKFKIPENARYAQITLKGRDQVFWTGAYGPKFSNIEVFAFSGDEFSTSVKNIQSEKENQIVKKFENGKIVILRGDKKFDLSGREIK